MDARVLVRDVMVEEPPPSISFRRALPGEAGSLRHLIVRSLGHLSWLNRVAAQHVIDH